MLSPFENKLYPSCNILMGLRDNTTIPHTTVLYFFPGAFIVVISHITRACILQERYITCLYVQGSI